MRRKTEEKLLNGIEKVIEEKRKLSVCALCNAAGLSRQSFYKYFTDLDGFLFWVHTRRVIDSFIRIIDQETDFYRSSFLTLFKMIEKHKLLYREMGLRDDQSRFRKLFIDSGTLFNLKYNSYMNEEKAVRENQINNLNMYFRGFVYYIDDFAHDRLPYDSEAIAGYLVETMPEVLKKWSKEMTLEVDFKAVFEEL